MKTRLAWINATAPLTLQQQCQLAAVPRSSVYAQLKRLKRPAIRSVEEEARMRSIDEEYTRHPFYGSRRMTAYLKYQGISIGRKKVAKLMGLMGLMGMAPGPNTSAKHPENKCYPYLLRGLLIDKPNQVWSLDITYIRLSQGFMYLVAVIDWYSRKVLSWRLSNTLESGFCVCCLEEALMRYGCPDIVNTDQGSQFTGEAFIAVLKQRDIAMSMDGRGRALIMFL